MISDATGETLEAIARAVTVQFPNVQPVTHIYALIRTPAQLLRVLKHVEDKPGIVLFTLNAENIRLQLESACQKLNIPAVAVLDPTLTSLRDYLGAESIPTIGGQHEINKNYFRRIEALNFSMSHDDGQNTDTINEADIVILGISRTSKTPTAIYLANRGYKTANIPLIHGLPIVKSVFEATNPLMVCLVAKPDYILHIRRNRLKSLNADQNSDYVDIRAIATEIRETRELAALQDWTTIDVTDRSIEELSAEILNNYQRRRNKEP
jgi:regulator of PEP synthase PpsR (kinase-PPPase family)